ncbi:MAG TPA: hypothetical protein ENJ00_10225 [Phycisphaerales bacterium]|nr:hypothetical protein [Phycisphaerales bacterium]
MATVTYDGQSFMIDGRRILLVAGQIDYPCIHHECWADRIHAAKLAGFNAIATSVPWAMHEPRPGQFDFTGRRDLRRFIQLIHQAGMLCVLRPGPYIGGQWDMGGIPDWVARKKDVKLRTGTAPFLESVSRYITAVAEQVRDLQVTSPGEGGPILLLQNESAWTCSDDDAAKVYLGELARYFREAGFTIPYINANNLWQGVEAEIEGWVGGDDMLATLRQLASVSPDQPRLAVDMPISPPMVVGGPSEPPVLPYAIQRRLAEILAGGGQFIAGPIAGGLIPGFWPGRDGSVIDSYYENTIGASAPIADTGAPGEMYHIIRRLTTMASSFARVFANLDHTYKPILLDQRRGVSGNDSIAVIDLVGSQGSVAFVLGPEPGVRTKSTKIRTADLLLGDGSSLTVSLGRQAVGWVLFDVLLASRAMMDYCTLNAMAVVGDVIVTFGPAGTTGSISINGSPLLIDVPKGKTPLVESHEGFTVVVGNEDSIDTIFATEDGVYLGVASVDASGEPQPLPGSKSCFRLDPKGKKERLTFSQCRPLRAGSAAVTLGDWKAVTSEMYISGSNARYASIAGPEDLAELGSPFGYGWYKIDFKVSDSKKHKLLSPRTRDRLHLYLDGEDAGVWGYGPGAGAEPIQMSLSKGEHTLVALAENLGRPSSGLHMDEPKGLVDHLYEIKPFKVGKFKIVSAIPMEPLEFRSPLWEFRPGDSTHPERAEWSFTHRRKSPIVISLDPGHSRVLVVLNDEPVRFIDQRGVQTLVFDQSELNRGANTLQMTVMSDESDPPSALSAVAASVRFVEGVEALTAKGSWSFAKWEPPAPSDFKAVPKSKLGSFSGPTWFKARFDLVPKGSPVRLELGGLTKGQLYFNGKHLCRYFVQDAKGHAVGPTHSVTLPEPMIRNGKKNELMIFDEHGGSPAKVKLSIDRATVAIRR